VAEFQARRATQAARSDRIASLRLPAAMPPVVEMLVVPLCAAWLQRCFGLRLQTRQLRLPEVRQLQLLRRLLFLCPVKP